jgi:hypothetical protein
MLLQGYKIEIFRPEQNPEFESLHCIAQLAQGVKEAPDCPELLKEARQGLEEYLERFHFEDNF